MTVTNETGCDNVITMNDVVEVYPQPEADFTADPTAATINNPEITFTELISGGFSLVSWDFGDGSTSTEENPVYSYTAPGEYQVIMYTENEFGCNDTAMLTISITENVKVFFPTAFTPNGDGLNDCFTMSGTTNDIIDKFGLRIYYRWGDVVYETTVRTPDCVWDGRDLEGNLVPADTYVYHIYGEDYKGNNYNFKGVIAVVR
jgi:gliding motility-associated-like protein